jgi:hypothetical protein
MGPASLPLTGPFTFRYMVQLAASAKIFWPSPPFVIRQMHALQAEMFRFPAAARKNPQAIDPRALAGPQCGGRRHRTAARHKKVGRNASKPASKADRARFRRCTLAFRSFVAQRSSPDLFGGAKVLFGVSKEVPKGALRRRSEETTPNVSRFTFFSLGPGLSLRPLKTTLVPPHPVLPFDIGVPFFISAVLRVSAQFWCLPKRNGRLLPPSSSRPFLISYVGDLAQTASPSSKP